MSFRELELKPEYRSLSDHVVTSFYNPILKESVLYKRAVGFFCSSSLIEITNGINGLLKNGGKIQLIASPKLTAEDIEAIEDGFERRNEIIEELLVRELADVSGKFEESRLNLLSNLIAAGKLEIKIAFLEVESKVGMFHEKMGLMYDSEDNIIAFTGSMNETANAFSTNYETIDVYKSWTGDADRVYAKQAAFNAMWNDYEPNIKVLSFPSIEKKIIEKYKTENITDFTTIDLIEKSEYPLVDESDDELIEEIAHPYVPSNVKIRPYQNDAISAWEERNFNGIFDMATGTGKTYTGLAAIAHLYKHNKDRLAVIIVAPYQHLVEQWKDDIIQFGMKPIICYSTSKQKDWRTRLKTAVTGFNFKAINHFCAITTNATFSGAYFQNEISKIKGDVVIVGDEAHNFGAENLATKLPYNFPFRLALSATIERHGDEEGTQKIYDYFGEKCIEYTLKDAIDNDMLTKYYYYPVEVSLNEEELAEYISLTEKLTASVAKHDTKAKKLVLSDYEKMILIKRARIVAGAREKIEVLREQIMPYKDDSNILVYCGATTYEEEKKGEIDGSEIRQIEKVVDMLGNELNMKVSPFTSEESAVQREQIKESFQTGKSLQALVAIRCLDEGVNIPSIRTAFILASSTNPKEYIQRRGRVLRKYPGKTKAEIFDFITLPIPLNEVDNYDENTIRAVSGLAKREIVRMKDFASISENPSAVDKLIIEIEEKYGLNKIDEGEELDEFYE